jgi:hypothetical protein
MKAQGLIWPLSHGFCDDVNDQLTTFVVDRSDLSNLLPSPRLAVCRASRVTLDAKLLPISLGP